MGSMFGSSGGAASSELPGGRGRPCGGASPAAGGRRAGGPRGRAHGGAWRREMV